jgi:hypothetical protein
MTDLWIRKQINQHITKSFFKYYDCGLLGCGRNSVPWLDLSSYLSLPANLEDIKLEVERLISRSEEKSGIVSCYIPKHLNNGDQLLTHYLQFIEQYIDSDIIQQFKTSDELDQYIYKHFAKPIWNSNLVLRKNTADYWNGKNGPDCQWVPFHAPALTTWIENLSIFKHIGRVVIFKNQKDNPVMMHRDAPYRSHKGHFVNIQLGNKQRPVYVYDEVTKEKIYITSSCYMFNETDLHGVDAEPDTAYTIRIDGTFTEQLCAELKLPLGLVWDRSFASGHKVNNITIHEPQYE